MTVSVASELPVPISHAEKKATRLRAQADAFQRQIDEVNARHATAIAIAEEQLSRAHANAELAVQALADIEHDIAALAQRADKLRKLLHIVETAQPKLLVTHDMRRTEYDRLLLALENEQRQHANAVLCEPLRHTAALQKKKDAVERRLALHLARVPLNALVPK